MQGPQPKTSFDVDHVLSQLKQNEKIALLSGIDFWHSHAIPEHNVPSLRVTDGPNGIRGTKFFAGVPAACLPCGTALAATFDKKLMRRAGELLGDEALAKGAHVWLGPTMNMQRSPLGGRGFESFSEDPYLSGAIGTAMVLGCESTGVIATPKHFVGNDQEHERRAVDCIVTPRALREIYLRPFQLVARDAKPGALMTSYNKINGKHVAEDPDMVQNLIRGEWQWDPLIISDWLGTYSVVGAMEAGMDLEMPGPTRYRGKYIDSAVQARLLKQSTIDARARRVLAFAKRCSEIKVSEEEVGRDFPEDRALNREICANSIVLLKNDEQILPLPKTVKKVALIGSHVRVPAISGGGSAALLPYYAVSLYDAVKELLPEASIIHETGCYAHSMMPAVSTQLQGGALVHFYNEPPTDPERKILGEETIKSASFQLMDYNNAPGLNKQLFWGTLYADFVPTATGTWEFGLTVFGTANLYVDDQLVVNNTTNQRKGTAFFGKGTVEEVGEIQMEEGKTYKLRIEFGSANTTTMETIGMVNFGGGAVHLGAILKMDPEQMVLQAIEAAKNADCTIICAGLSGEWESEGFDRPHMDLPPGVDDMITRVLEAAPNAVVVNQSGTPITMRWADKAKAIVHAWYGGNETGHGMTDVIFGDVSPSAKLSLSWPYDNKHNPAYLHYESVNGRVLYGEDIYVGYKFYDKTERETRFPFGHGLSYTTFELSNDAQVEVQPKIFTPESPSVAIVKVKNTGKVAGAQVLQAYIAAPNSPTGRPLKELFGFEKAFLQPGEEQEVRIPIDQYATSFWCEIESMWKSEAGSYDILIASSSKEILGKGEMVVPKTRHWIGL
ncbi:glycoside hydrolase family 3 protein [Sarocladium strictum]